MSRRGTAPLFRTFRTAATIVRTCAAAGRHAQARAGQALRVAKVRGSGALAFFTLTIGHRHTADCRPCRMCPPPCTVLS